MPPLLEIWIEKLVILEFVASPVVTPPPKPPLPLASAGQPIIQAAALPLSQLLTCDDQLVKLWLLVCHETGSQLFQSDELGIQLVLRLVPPHAVEL